MTTLAPVAGGGGAGPLAVPPAGWRLLRRAALGLLGERDPGVDEIPREAAARLGHALRGLSDVLVAPVGPGGHPPYMDHDETRAAYLVGLAPRTLCAAWHELPALPPGAAVLDLGAGTGAASLACVLRGAGKVDLVDRSSRALRDARAILEGAGATEVRAVGATLEDPRGWPVRDRYDVVVLGFSLLEAAREDERLAGAIIDAAAGRVADGGWLLVLDSAQRPRARVLNGLRPRLLEAGLRLWAPCPHALPCPALERPRDFCHAARAWDLPEDLARVRAEGRLSDDRLTYAFLLAGRAPPPSLRVTARVMGDVQQEKGRARLAVCTATDVRELVALKRHRDAYAGLTSLARGDALGLTLPQGGGPAWRVEDAAVLEPVVSS